MYTYECTKCGMSVNASCGKCDTPPQNDHLILDDGTSVQISSQQQNDRQRQKVQRIPITPEWPVGAH